MRAFTAFIKKEITDSVRSGRCLLLIILFTVIGVMNPAVAKLTPLLLDVMGESLAQSGITVTEVNITAMDSWVQFFKNIPMALIAFVLIEGNVFTKEYSSGTLILSLTKGLSRYKVVLSKSALLLCEWTALYWLCFGITYAYNAYFWDNTVAKSLALSSVAWWLFGVFTVSLIVFFSTVATSLSRVLLGTGGAILALYLAGLFKKASAIVPTALTDGSSLIYGAKGAEDYTNALWITAALTLVLLFVSIPLFQKKKL